MFIATLSDKSIHFFGKATKTWSNGYPVIVNDNLETGFIPGSVTIHEVPDDSEFEVYKTCYTPELGFYPNPNWREPSPFDDEQYAAGYEQALLDLLEEE